MSSDTFHPEQSYANNETTVRALYTELMEGWNKGSGAAFSAPFAEDGHLVAFDGMHFQGRDEIASFHRPLFEKWLKGTRLVGEVESVHFLSSDIALMHARGGTVMRGKTQFAPERDSIQALAAVRRDGEIEVAGPHLAQSCTDLGLIHEYRIYLRPVVLGRGVPYFAGPRPPLKLVAYDRTAEDVIRLTYVPA